MARNIEDVKRVEKSVEIVNKLGFHARAASSFVKTAEKFQSEILVIKDDMEANGKSILGLLTLGAAKGTEVRIVAIGPDADEAVEALVELVENRFGEEE